MFISFSHALLDRALFSCIALHKGSNSPNFFCQAKICQRTAFGKKLTVHFDQHFPLNLDKICHIIMPDL